jgi:hypothetical protein
MMTTLVETCSEKPLKCIFINIFYRTVLYETVKKPIDSRARVKIHATIPPVPHNGVVILQFYPKTGGSTVLNLGLNG